jgi:hypothetical protein
MFGSWDISAPHSVGIAQIVAGIDGNRTPVADANARLIAAAPDLLQACRIAREAVDSLDVSLGDRALDALISAIAKAEGR